MAGVALSELLDALAWQIELGADEAICDTPIDRLAVAETPSPAVEKVLAPVSVLDKPAAQPDMPDDRGAAALAAQAGTLAALKAAIEAFEGCELKKGARHTVFADGNPAAKVMIIGEAPGRDEDMEGRPFVGRSGQLLDRMLAAIDLARGADAAEKAVYITNVLPWRPPQNRDPSTDEIVMMKAFLLRHIALAAPEVIVTMGNAATRTLLDTVTGITRMRGTWVSYGDIPVLPMFHPAALLRNPLQKREAWADLLALKARLRTL